MKIKVRLYLLVSVLLGAILSVLFAIAQKSFVDPSTLLVTSSPAVTMLNITIALAVGFMLVAGFVTFRKARPVNENGNSIPCIVASWLMALLFAVYFIGYFAAPVRRLLMASPEISAISDLSKILYFASAISALFCTVYFVCLATRKKTGLSAGIALLSVFPILFFALRLIYYFMQTSASVNISGRKLIVVCLCLCTAFFLCEARLHTSLEVKKDGKKERAGIVAFYLASGFGAILTLLLLIPNPLYIAASLYIMSRIYNYSRNL